jgi:hypothetical protein
MRFLRTDALDGATESAPGADGHGHYRAEAVVAEP